MFTFRKVSGGMAPAERGPTELGVRRKVDRGPLGTTAPTKLGFAAIEAGR